MTAGALLSDLREAGVVLTLSGPDHLKVDAPKGVITPELRDALVKHKPELLKLVAQEAARSEEAARKEERQKADAEAKRVEEEARRRVEEEKRASEATEAQRKAEEEATRKAEEEAEQKRQAEEQARLQAEQEAERQRAKKEAARKRIEEEARRKVEEEQRRRAEEQERVRAEADAARKRAEEETLARKKTEEEAARKRAEESARRRAEEEAAQKRVAEEAERRAAAEEARRLEEEEGQRAEAEARRRAEEEARLQVEAEARQRAEEEARLKAEEEARHAEAESRRLAEEKDAARRRTEEEAVARQKAEAEEAALLLAEMEAEERRAEEEALRVAEEDARLRSEEEARRRSEEESAEFPALTLESTTEIVTTTTQYDSGDTSVYEIDEEITLERQENASGWVEIDMSEPEIVRHATPIGKQPAQSTPVEEPALIAEPETVIVEPEWETAETFTTSSAIVEVADDASTTAAAKEIVPVVGDKGIAPLVEDEFSNLPGNILRRLSSEDATVRAAAVGDLVRLGGDDSFREITAAFDDPAQEVRDAAARALYGLDTDRAASFTRALREAPPERRRSIGSSLATSGLAEEAISHLMGESREKTYDAFSLLFLMSKAGEVQPLMRAIEEHPNNEVRLAVVKLLALSGQQEILPAFRRLAVRGSLPTEVRSAVMEAIYQISSQSSDASSAA
jgi:hypothetical protein